MLCTENIYQDTFLEIKSCSDEERKGRIFDDDQ